MSDTDRIANLERERASDEVRAQETIAAVRKRAEHAERERDTAKSLLAAANERAERAESHAKRAEEVAHQLERELNGAMQAVSDLNEGALMLERERDTAKSLLAAANERAEEAVDRGALEDSAIYNRMVTAEARCKILEGALKRVLNNRCSEHEDACCEEWCRFCQQELASREAARAALSKEKDHG